MLNEIDYSDAVKLTIQRILKCLFKFPTYFLCTLLLVACEASPSSTPSPPPTRPTTASNLETRQAIQAILDREVRARQEADQAAFQALLDLEADTVWQEKQIEQVQQGRLNLQAIVADRIVVVDQWALVTVIREEAPLNGPNTSAEQKTYTLRTLRHLDDQGWKLTAPTPTPWGEQQVLSLSHLHLSYYSFDEPYVQAIAPRVESFLAQMAQDFGISLADTPPLTVEIVPADSSLLFWDQASGNKLPSPVTPGFSLTQAERPEQFLLGTLADFLGHLLFERAFSVAIEDEGRLRLAHIAINWEVNEVTGGQADGHASRKLLRDLHPSAEIASLSELLDPSKTFANDNAKAIQREALIYFFIERYGREVIRPFIQAIVAENDWQGIIRVAFGQDPADVEQAWQTWMAG